MCKLWGATAFWVGLLSSTAAASADPWAAMTVRDVQAAYELIRDDHPGPVDPANPAFAARLDTGYAAARAEAERARSLGDYQRTLRRFVNGFRDNHLRVRFEAGTDQAMWPGFSVRWDSDDRFVVAVSEEAEAPPGSEILSCDGEPLAARMERDVLPFIWNPELPHARKAFSANLMIADPQTPKPVRCSILRTGLDGPVETTLRWRPLNGPDAAHLRRQTNGLVVPPRGIREIGGVTFISLPGMDADPGLESFLAEVEERAGTLRTRPVLVFDVRGNSGGISTVGYRLLKAFYGDEPINRIVNSFDWTNAVRATSGNAARYRATADVMLNAGGWSSREIDGVRGTGDRIEAAIAQGDPFLQGGRPAQPLGEWTPPIPFTGRVFLLTDPACASACLDLVDVMRRLPGVTHVGLQTQADAIYMESRHETLPSGLARLTFGIKVYRNRIRANNEWYEPEVPWPGGEMSDQAIASWLTALADR